MTAMTALREIVPEPVPAEASAGPELDWLLASLQTNRFMPHPPPDSIFVGDGEVVHAYAAAGCVLLSRMDEPLLTHLPLTGGKMLRPVKFFDMWSAGQ